MTQGLTTPNPRPYPAPASYTDRASKQRYIATRYASIASTTWCVLKRTTP